NLELREQLSAEDPELVQFAELAEAADPMPAIPAMAAIWGPLGIAQANIVGGADPHSTMTSAGEEISSLIGCSADTARCGRPAPSPAVPKGKGAPWVRPTRRRTGRGP